MNFIKGIFVGIGGVAPGLSGSVLLVIFGLYQKTINAVSTFFKEPKKNLKFLIPLFIGIGIGVLAFSNIVDFLLNTFEKQTRFAFLGLIAGTVPMFYKETKKEGISPKHYVIMAVAAAAGLALFFFNRDLFPKVTDPSLFQSVILGVAVAGSSLVPGVDSAAILSALGLYELYVSSVANLNMHILIPAAFGLVGGGLIIAFVINWLIKHFYTVTFSVVFGLFLSIIPGVLNGSCYLGADIGSVVSIIVLILGFIASLYFENIQGWNSKIKAWFSK